MRPAVFMFGADGGVDVAASLTDAWKYMEGIDIASGKYEAVITSLGEAVEASARGDEVLLLLTGRFDQASLVQRLRRLASRWNLTADPEDPEAIAAELLRCQWEARWPKKPAWLSHLIHGPEPSV